MQRALRERTTDPLVDLLDRAARIGDGEGHLKELVVRECQVMVVRAQKGVDENDGSALVAVLERVVRGQAASAASRSGYSISNRYFRS